MKRFPVLFLAATLLILPGCALSLHNTTTVVKPKTRKRYYDYQSKDRWKDRTKTVKMER